MDIQFFEQLYRRELIDISAVERVQQQEQQKQVSVHRELNTLLYLGILLFCSGFGIFIYKNINTIGHLTLIALIAVLMGVCFVYCFRHKYPYSNLKVPVPNIWFDYILLLGCLLLLTFIGYTQFQYHLFGERWGLALFIPALLLFCFAYYFDHIGILSLAITNLAAWVGIAVSPLQLLSNNDFTNYSVIYSGALLGIALLALSGASMRYNVKAHFALTYKNFGFHLFFIAVLAGSFQFSSWFLAWLLVLGVAAVYQFFLAVRQRSFYFLLFTLLYSYVGLSYLVIRALTVCNSSLRVALGFYYFIGSSIGLIILLTMLNRKLHRKDDRI